MAALQRDDLGRVVQRKCVGRLDQSVLGCWYHRVIERASDERTRNFAPSLPGDACRGRVWASRIVRRQQVKNGRNHLVRHISVKVVLLSERLT